MRSRGFAAFTSTLVLCFAFLAFSTTIAIRSGSLVAAGSIGIVDLVKNPATYSGTHVDVSGSVANVQPKVSHAGHDYETFDLCDINGNCVRVFAWGHPALHEGDKIDVRGVFSETKRVGRYSFHNEIEADEGSL